MFAAKPLRAQGLIARPLVLLGSDEDERLRLGGLLPRGNAPTSMFRSVSGLTKWLDSTDRVIAVILPNLRVVRNSELPYSLNEGSLWAGRGWNREVTAGLALDAGRLRIIAAPTAVSSENRVFQVIPFPQRDSTSRSVWANPFHPLPESIDLPLRFGDRPVRRIDPGQSSVTVRVGSLGLGVATENLWWGPGIRNAIALSNNAPGFPHAFVQTAHPIGSPWGPIEAQWFVGSLTESDFFDRNPQNDRRSLTGVVLSWRPAVDTGLTLGVARLVMGPASGLLPFSAAFDVLRSAGHTNVDTARAIPADPRDQIFSTFVRWALPQAGFEAYAEWARFEEPRSLRDFLEFPGHSEGYTLGTQWARPLRAQRTFRLQAEATYLEPDPSLRLRPTAITYTSRGLPQGFTNRGRTLGAAIGPGASSQWLGGDVFDRLWRVGAYVSRIRWDNGALEEPIVPMFKRQDVTLAAGMRAGASWHGVTALVDFSHATRFNYLFQAYALDLQGRTAGIDLVNNTLSLTLSAAALPR